MPDWYAIGDEIKGLEHETEIFIPPDKGFVVRLDGWCFHTFTKGMKRPFDHRMNTAMVATLANLLTKFTCLTGYTQSDEITLWFPPQNDEQGQSHPHNGRVQKLCSILAAFTSVRFNKHLQDQVWDDNAIVRQRVQDTGAMFDARIFIPKTDEQLLHCFLWRQQFDCFRNAISNIACVHYSAKERYGVKTQEHITKLKNDGIDVFGDQFEDHNIYGTFMKKRAINIMVSPSLGSPCVRTTVCEHSLKTGVDLDFLQARRCQLCKP